MYLDKELKTNLFILAKFKNCYKIEWKKPGKIYYSTFRGHRDSIIKRLV